MSFALEDVLDWFALEDDISKDTLVAYIERYPGFVIELTDLFHEIQMVNLEIEREQVELRVHETVDLASQSNELDLTSVFAGGRLKTLAKSLALPRSLLAALRDGIIRVETIPDTLLQAVADLSDTTFDALKAALDRPSTYSARLAFKSNIKPKSAAETVSFQEYLKQSTLSPEQQEELLTRYGRD
jgi:hypothetical protein